MHQAIACLVKQRGKRGWFLCMVKLKVGSKIRQGEPHRRILRDPERSGLKGREHRERSKVRLGGRSGGFADRLRFRAR